MSSGPYVPTTGSESGGSLYSYYDPDDAHGQGLVTFAGVMLMIAGVLNSLYGIAAIGKANVFVHNARYVFGDLRTWGWFVLALGVVQFLAALAIWRGVLGALVRRRLRQRQRDPADAVAARVSHPGADDPAARHHRHLRAARLWRAASSRPGGRGAPSGRELIARSEGRREIDRAKRRPVRRWRLGRHDGTGAAPGSARPASVTSWGRAPRSRGGRTRANQACPRHCPSGGTARSVSMGTSMAKTRACEQPRPPTRCVSSTARAAPRARAGRRPVESLLGDERGGGRRGAAARGSLDINTTTVRRCVAWIRKAASIPSMSGIRTSRSTRSGSSCSTALSASPPEAASPTASKSPAASSSTRIALRTIGWSSTTRTRTGSGIGDQGSRNAVNYTMVHSGQ